MKSQFLFKGLKQQNQQLRDWAVVGSVSNEADEIRVQSSDVMDQQNGVVIGLEREPKLGAEIWVL